METTSPETIVRIRQLNDAFRSTFIGGNVVMTAGVARYKLKQLREILLAVRTFDAFTPDNDPHGEHDFGTITFEGQALFWKIDCYALDMMHGSEDPSDPASTIRVMTIMLAEEY